MSWADVYWGMNNVWTGVRTACLENENDREEVLNVVKECTGAKDSFSQRVQSGGL